ncbi:hypothetical protein [Aeromicrobium sp. 9AM]|uniref:hypothetical protein n=1 Tax=Aeromicrobium sp. 9AM TaxID=2653126 RepID=UPI0012F02011|nr:hypothetical protein [Aeromicrobium sp. 9AM]VXB17946.1 conserved hypothetical protein [Aeromicrobium sp. 9AM]
MNSATIDSQHSVKTSEYVLWAAATLVAGFFVPGLGIVIGLVLAYTRLRSERSWMRWSLVAVGAVLLVLQVAGMATGGGDHDVSPVSRVT